MWRCTNCYHLELSPERPFRCPVCGADTDKLVEHRIPDVKGEKTPRNLKVGFVAESQAHLRNMAFAMKAEQQGYLQVARLFRAIAESEAIHAFNHLRLLDGVSDTQDNLEAAFERENLAGETYPEMIKDANREGNAQVARAFSFHRDVERGHAKLYEKALEHMLGEVDTEYHVCNVCGYVCDGEPPDECPICGAPRKQFKKV